MGSRDLSKLRRELARPVRRLGRYAYKAASGVYSPYLYDMTAGRKVRVSDGALQMTDRVGIFVVAPFHGIWPSHLAVLEQMHAAGLSPLVVSNAPLSDADQRHLLDRCAVLIERPNHGYDFGAYREACLFLGGRLPALSRLTLLNDSTWVPFGVADWLRGMAQPGCTGATSNFGAPRHLPSDLTPEPWRYDQGHPEFHLQSYALSFGHDILRDPAFHAFWRRYPLVNDKDLTVARGEVGLSQWALWAGFSLNSTYPIERLDQHLEALSEERLREITENTIVLGNPKFHALKQHVLNGACEAETLRTFILAAARCLGVCYALPDLNLREMGAPFLKKSPVWHQKEASDITLRIIASCPEMAHIQDEALFLRQKQLVD